MSEIAKEVTDDDFAQAVIERSKEIPVVVDLWAPWCGPCRNLAPLLEGVAERRKGEFELTKLNVDDNPQIAGQLGARSIPLVVAFRDGEVVSHFLGLQPESQIDAFIDEIVPTEADILVRLAGVNLQVGNLEQAEQQLNQAIELDHRHERARLTLARVLEAADRIDEALDALRPVASTGHDEAAALHAELELKLSGDVDMDDLEAKVAADGDDLDSAIALGKALGAQQEYERALELLISAVEKDAAYNEGEAKQAVLDIFNILGMQDPTTKQFRPRLSRALF